MADSYARYVASGQTSVYTVTFPYLDKAHVFASINDVPVQTRLEWISSGQINLGFQPAAGSVIQLYRRTPATPLVTFTPGNLDTQDLNVATLQAIFLAQEAVDLAEDNVARIPGEDAYDAHGRVIKNLGAGVADGDAATLGQAKALAAAGAAPTVDAYTKAETDTKLAGKANTAHTHLMSDVSGLATALAAKAAAAHTHLPADVTGLQALFDAKANIADVWSKAASYQKSEVDALVAGAASAGAVYAGNVTRYGAKGDNATDDTAAFEAAIAANTVVYVPAGKYLVKRRLLRTGALVLFGDGTLASRIVWTGATGYGIKADICGSGDPRETVQVRDVGLVSREYAAGSIALAVKRAQTVPDVCMSVQVRDTFVGRDTNAFQQGFTIGIDLDGCANSFVDTFVFAGKVTGGSGSDAGEPNYDSTHGIRYHNASGAYPHPTVLNVTNTEIFHAKNGIYGTDMEGLLVNGGQIVGCNYGVVAQGLSSYGDPHVSVIGTHINCSVRSILVKKMSQIVITGNVLYSQLQKDAGAVQIEVSGGSNFLKIVGNDFESLSPSYAANSIYVDDTAGGVISANCFRRTFPVGGSSGGTAITLGAGASNITVANDNVFAAEVGTHIVDLGTGNMMPGYGGRFGKSGDQALSAGSLNIAIFDAVQTQRGNLGDNLADGAFVIPSAGLWVISASAQLSAVGVSDTVIVNIQKNATSGNAVKSDAPCFVANAPTVVAIEHTEWFEKGDVIRLGINSGQSRTLVANANTFLALRRVA